MGKKISLRATCDELGISLRGVRRLISSGELRAYRVGKGAVRIDVDDAMHNVGSAGNQINVDKFVEQTRILSEQWTLFVHQLETDLKPVGEFAIQGLITGVQGFGTWIDAHKGEILDKVKSFGDGFIQALPGIQHFTGEAIRLTGLFFEFMKTGAMATIDTLSELIQVWGTLTGDDALVKKGQGFMDMANELNKLDFGTLSDTLANLLESPNIDTSKLQQKFDEAMGKVGAASTTGTPGASIDIHPVVKTPDGADAHDPKAILGIPPDGVHVPVIPVLPGGANADGSTNLPPWIIAGPSNFPSGAPAYAPGTGIPTPGGDWNGQGPPTVGGIPMPGLGDHVAVAGSWRHAGGADKGYGSTGPGLGSGDLSGGGYIDAPGFPGGRVWVAPGEKPSEAMSRAKKSVDDANRMGTLSNTVGDLQKQRDAMVSTDPRVADLDAKLAKAKKDLLDATEAQTIDAQKQLESTTKTSSSSSSGKSADPGDLLTPLFDMLGLGNILGGKPPSQWGIVKALESLAGYGLGLANMAGDIATGPGGILSGQGGPGGGGGGPLGGLLNSLGLGNLLPHVQGSTGPAPGPSGPDSGGPPAATAGPAPAPAAGDGRNWGALADAESGTPGKPGSANWANKSNPKYSGGLQFDQPTWDQFKPPGAPGNAADATKEQQIAAAENALGAGRTPESLWPTNYAQLNTPGPTGPAQTPTGSGPSIGGVPGVKDWIPPRGAPGGMPLPQNRTSLGGPTAPAAAPAALTGVGPFSYGGITAGDNASTGLSRYGGIPGAPSGKGQELLNFMQGQMNLFNQQTGSNLTVTADYPGGPHGHPDDGADHSVRRALDIGGTPQQMDKFAAWWFNNPALRGATRQLIHDPVWDKDPNNPFTGDMNIIGGHATSGPQTYAGAPYAPGPGGGGHADHVHIALEDIPNVSNAPNVAPAAAPSADTSGGPPNVHVAGDYNFMPMSVTPSAIDPKPAVRAMQDHLNSQVRSAGDFGGVRV